MSGIFPPSGVVAGSTTNATTTANILASCDALFYRTGVCNAYFDPAAMNAIMSELLNLATAWGHTWDCDSLTNLADAIVIPPCLTTDLDGTVPAGPTPRIWYNDTTNTLMVWDCEGAAYAPFDQYVAGPDLDAGAPPAQEAGLVGTAHGGYSSLTTLFTDPAGAGLTLTFQDVPEGLTAVDDGDGSYTVTGTPTGPTGIHTMVITAIDVNNATSHVHQRWDITATAGANSHVAAIQRGGNQNCTVAPTNAEINAAHNITTGPANGMIAQITFQGDDSACMWHYTASTWVNIASAAGVCAWAHYDTAAFILDAQLNIASVIPLTGGAYRITFITPMADANYVISGTTVGSGIPINVLNQGTNNFTVIAGTLAADGTQEFGVTVVGNCG